METETDPLFAQIAGHEIMNAAYTDRAAVQAALNELRWWHEDTYHRGDFACGGCLVEQAIAQLETLLAQAANTPAAKTADLDY